MSDQETIPAAEFDPAHLPEASRTDLDLVISSRPAGGHVALPAVVVRGARPGRTLVAVAGVHGDEFEGVQALGHVCGALDPADMSGALVAVPVANPLAFENGTRAAPIDRQDMARVFPGDPDGTAAERFAHALSKHVIPHGDLFADLHSAGALYTMPRLAGWPICGGESEAAAKAAAMAFGAPVVWGSRPAPGRSLAAAAEADVPAVYVECTGTGGVRDDDLAWYCRGIHNLLRHLAILPGEPEIEPDPLVIAETSGYGNLDTSPKASAGGLWEPCVGLLAAVRAGDVVGTVRDPWGRTLQEACAPRDGRVILLRHFSRVAVGENLFQLT